MLKRHKPESDRQPPFFTRASFRDIFRGYSLPPAGVNFQARAKKSYYPTGKSINHDVIHKNHDVIYITHDVIRIDRVVIRKE